MPFLGSGGPQRIGRSDACDRCLAARSGSRRDACPARRHGTHHPQPNPSQVANGFDNGWRAVPLRRRGKNKGPAGATHPPVAQLSAAAVSQVATHARTAKKMGAALNRDHSVSSGPREASRSLCGRCNHNSHFNQCNRRSQNNRPLHYSRYNQQVTGHPDNHFNQHNRYNRAFARSALPVRQLRLISPAEVPECLTRRSSGPLRRLCASLICALIHVVAGRIGWRPTASEWSGRPDFSKRRTALPNGRR